MRDKQRLSTPGARAAVFLFLGRYIAHVAGAPTFLLHFLHLGLFLGHALHEGFLIGLFAGLEFGLGHLAHQPGLTDREDVLGGPVKGERRGKVVTEEEEHDGHQHHDALLHLVASGGRHLDLQKTGDGHHGG